MSTSPQSTSVSGSTQPDAAARQLGDSLASGRERSSIREGFRVIGVGIRREPWIFTLSTVGSLMFGALTVADAWVLGWATDNVLLPAFTEGFTTRGLLITIVALFLGVALLRAVGIVARRIGAGLMQYRLQATYRKELSRRYLELPFSWHQRHPTGQLLSNANADVEAAWAPIAPLPMAVGTIAMLVVAVAQMLLVNLTMALVGLLVFPAVAGATLLYQYFSSPLFTKIQILRSELSEIAHESFDGAMVIKTLGREEEETARFAAKTHQLRDLGIKVGRIRAAFDPLLELIPGVGVLAVLIVGAWQVQSGVAVAGDVVTIAYLLTIVAFPIRSMGWLLGEFPRSVVGFDRVQKVLDDPTTTSFGSHRHGSPVAGAKVEVADVEFSYASNQPVLHKLSFGVKPGKTVAIVGETAAGKSTLTLLLSRLIDPTAGRLTLDGIDLRAFAPGELAQQVALVPQQAFLFDDTVRANLTLGASIADAQLWHALQIAQADSFVAALPQGLDSRLGERGASLSGGQRQRLVLARALLRQPRLLILDDATSAVDPEVEAKILQALQHQHAHQAGSTTLILIAYRKATIALADEVLFLRDGHIAARGTHRELLATHPAYATLVNAYDDPEAAASVNSRMAAVKDPLTLNADHLDTDEVSE